MSELPAPLSGPKPDSFAILTHRRFCRTILDLGNNPDCGYLKVARGFKIRDMFAGVFDPGDARLHP